MADENVMWRTHVEPKMRPFLDMVRVHRATQGGIADVWYSERRGARNPAVSGWVELKYLRKTDRDTLPLRPGQALFLMQRAVHCVPAFLLVWDSTTAVKGGEWHIIPAEPSPLWVTAVSERATWRTRSLLGPSAGFPDPTTLARILLCL